MTGLSLLLFNMWLLFTWYDIQNYTCNTDTWSYEYQISYEESQKSIIIEDYFEFTKRFPKTRYARWCAWWYEKATYKDGKRNSCSKNAFDCAWMMKAYWYVKWIISQKDIWLYNSSSLYELWTPKDPRLAERWDFTYWRWYGDRWTGNLSTHFAVISRAYSWWTIGVWDYTKNVPKERILKVSCNATYCNYAGRFRIFVSTNWFFEKSMEEWITVDPFVVIDTWSISTWRYEQWNEKDNMCEYDPNNPMWFSATMSWYAYDSLANRILSLWYNYNQDLDMMAKFIAEAHFNPEAVGKEWEKWICQLLSNATNNVWINDPRWSDPMRQAKICMEKWEAVPENNRDMIRRANWDTEKDNIILHIK